MIAKKVFFIQMDHSWWKKE